MATIGGVRGRGSAHEVEGPDGTPVLNGRIRVHSNDYPRVGDLFATLEPVEYRGPVERGGRRTTQSLQVFLLRVGVPDSASVAVYFETANTGSRRWAATNKGHS